MGKYTTLSEAIKDLTKKGLMVNAYGIYADYASFKLVQKLNRPER